ncbi:glycerophosphoinositol permease [Yamadazyma tenuis]|uniref:MFS general substrate transporter n=1 Tax=Candida tenuis (strain ATCC 10573 / BCRC 21748 / CBS 615 / JCM 9827 / NBRC 10315 / NRRL Y-1498 / VKM Y-70) TaxID=590646 RepID=G3BDV6_CANTC|nr:MFS general substrate transporter [Yamadazyma tenuis ATCC 10573]EGV60392.1 MFS general substrate transporter [Yamadazyma tenuis ATCC 10573]WEJ94363.1 glycerophosphoinositol permease [Yamadazyma tenuis]
MATRDLPKSFKQLSTGWIQHLDNEITFNRKTPSQIKEEEDPNYVRKVKMKNLWPAFCAGAGLFSEGYVNNSISTVSTILSRIYGTAYSESNAISNVSSIAFVGIVLGQLGFGYVSDHIHRKGGMLVANVMLIFFTLLTAVGTWGAHGSPGGLFAALTTFRFFLGIAIGAEYPTSSVIASEFANQLPSGHRNRYFVWFTDFMIDFGFVVSAFVPLVLLWIFSTRHLTAVWRLTLGLGVFPPLALFFMRLKVADSDAFKKMNIKRVKKVPFLLIAKFYWFRLFIVSFIWFLYNFSVYSFGTYSSYIFAQIIPTDADGNADLYKTFGWNVVFNLFYIPGSFLGGLMADYFGPRLTLAIGVGLQAVVGFIMAGCYDSLAKHIAAFIVVFGIFSALGEVGPGDNIGLLASKTSATAIRGEYYGIAAAWGKIGAFVGTWVFPVIISHTDGVKTPIFISSGFCVISCILALFFVPPVGQDAINKEDDDFLNYLVDNGFDVSQLGESVEIDEQAQKESEGDSDVQTVNEILDTKKQ